MPSTVKSKPASAATAGSPPPKVANKPARKRASVKRAKSRAKVARMASQAPTRAESPLDFATACKEAGSMFATATSAEGVRAVYRAYVGVLGLKALGRVLLYGADWAISKRNAK